MTASSGQENEEDSPKKLKKVYKSTDIAMNVKGYKHLVDMKLWSNQNG